MDNNRSTSIDTEPKDWQALSRRQSVLIGLLVVAIPVLIMREGIARDVGIEAMGKVLIAGILITLGILVTYAFQKFSWVSCIVIGLCAVLTLIAYPNFVNIKSHGPDVDVFQGLHAIKLAIDRYEHDEGKYPVDLEDLRIEGYLPVFPENEYKYPLGYSESQNMGAKELKLATEMKNMSVSKEVSWDNMPGNFLYLPQSTNDKSDVLTITGYTLLGFAKHSFNEQDWVVVNCIVDAGEHEDMQTKLRR